MATCGGKLCEINRTAECFLFLPTLRQDIHWGAIGRMKRTKGGPLGPYHCGLGESRIRMQWARLGASSLDILPHPGLSATFVGSNGGNRVWSQVQQGAGKGPVQERSMMRPSKVLRRMNLRERGKVWRQRSGANASVRPGHGTPSCNKGGLRLQ